MLLLSLSFLLLLGGVFLIGYYNFPLLTEKWKAWQKKEAKKAALTLENAFIFVREKRLYIVYIGLPLVLGGIGFIFLKIIGLVIGVGIGLLLPFMVVKGIVAKRRKKFDSQLIDILMMINSCLKGGLTLIQSFEVVMEEMSPPASEEFGLVVREVKIGVSFEEALLNLNKRMKSEDMELAISAIIVARETGGNLPQIFSRLINVIRDRIQVKEMAQTLTLQGRIQGLIMSLIPIVFVIMVWKINPHHFDIMLRDDFGRRLLMLAVVLQIIGLFLIRKFSIVKV